MGKQRPQRLGPCYAVWRESPKPTLGYAHGALFSRTEASINFDLRYEDLQLILKGANIIAMLTKLQVTHRAPPNSCPTAPF
ncbi:hypothetical protein SB4_01175 [Sphingomonas sanguinis]|uniref:Uncharacterized protein n=1 Tax=Sphingomonas sanguinis TaxID=33051 RepID=A0A147J2X7_9SPHN|nr:hypothetical protein SB4_01175 [Sphingomonas sanguinis]